MYQQQFQVFLQKCNQRECMYKQFDKVSAKFANCKSVVSFGSGTCAVDFRFAQGLPSLESYQLVEPICTKPEFNEMIYAFHATTYEEFMKTHTDKFDIVLHCHDFYYLDNKKKVLHECLQMLNKDGFMLVILEDHDGIAHIRQKFCPTKYYFPSNLLIEMIANDQVLKKYLIDIIDIDGVIDINDDPMNGDYLLNFFLLGNSEKLESLRLYLREHYPNGSMPQTSKMFIFGNR